MFATQHYMDPMQDQPKKRGRDDDPDLVSGVPSFSEHRNKRLQNLPLRTSPKSSHQVTPLNAPQEHLFRPHLASYSPEGYPQQPQDEDMDAMNVTSPSQVAYLASNLGDSDATTRIPTPIQPSFAAQVRGQQCEWAGTGPVGGHNGSCPNDGCAPSAMATESDWQTLQSNRRLPSPISECDDSVGNQLMNPQAMTPDHCEHSAPFHSPNNMEHPNASMDTERSRVHDTDADSLSPSPRRGHMRSKHTINSWTWQPGMKRSFSIGYRADCEKCRLKVPGHFNHIIIS
uniref:Uncharacterized protein n=1 Tax=Bionectria ochroleuca TaxID=29856 RepID=A0A8H7TPN0_BIOOC